MKPTTQTILIALAGAVIGTTATNIYLQQEHLQDRLTVMEAQQQNNIPDNPIFQSLRKLTGQNKEFSPAIPKEEQTYLDQKVGFKYVYDAQTKIKIPGTENLPDLGMFYNRYGKKYTFEVKRLFIPTEELRIGYSTGNGSSSVYVHIEDRNRDGTIDDIQINDYKNNTTLIICRKDGVRSSSGPFEYKGPVDETSAKKLYDHFSAIYRQFKADHAINALIDAYTPKVEITDIEINKPQE